MGGWWRWALVSPDGVAPSRMVNVSASVNLPMHHKVQKFSSGTGGPGKRAAKRLWCGVVVYVFVAFMASVMRVGYSLQTRYTHNSSVKC